MYRIFFFDKEQDEPVLALKTEDRNLARSAVLLGKENSLDVRVVREVESVEVKFKGVSS